MKKKESKKYLFIFALLFLIFLMPLIVAILLFNKNPNWLHQQTVNKGTLISEHLILQQLKLVPQKTTLRSFKNKWLLFYLTPSPCNRLCQKNLYRMRQIILALGKYRHQVQYALILIKDNPLATYPFPSKDANLLNYTTSKLHAQKIFSALNIKNHHAAYFIADPFGRIILYYSNNSAGENIYQDLMRLLIISTTG
ncbi:MAG: hypothetical protein E6K54_07120 [Gammaproteobacteria bacterium]|nr:MAG: hypothetical protein E6K54_07120 [Gammaproteobacteria bacterium]